MPSGSGLLHGQQKPARRRARSPAAVADWQQGVEVGGVVREREAVELAPGLRGFVAEAEQRVDPVHVLDAAAAAELRRQVVAAQANVVLGCGALEQRGAADLVRTHELVLVEQEDGHLGGVQQLLRLRLEVALGLLRETRVAGRADAVRLVDEEQVEAMERRVAHVQIPLEQLVRASELCAQRCREGLAAGRVRGAEAEAECIGEELHRDHRLAGARPAADHHRRTALVALESPHLGEDRLVGLALVVDQMPALLGSDHGLEVRENARRGTEAGAGDAVEHVEAIAVADARGDEVREVVDVGAGEQGARREEIGEARVAEWACVVRFEVVEERAGGGADTFLDERGVVVGEPLGVVECLARGMDVFDVVDEDVLGELVLECRVRPLLELDGDRGAFASAGASAEQRVDALAGHRQVILRRHAGLGAGRGEIVLRGGEAVAELHADVAAAQLAQREGEMRERVGPAPHLTGGRRMAVDADELPGHVAGQRAGVGGAEEIGERAAPEVHRRRRWGTGMGPGPPPRSRVAARSSGLRDATGSCGRCDRDACRAARRRCVHVMTFGRGDHRGAVPRRWGVRASPSLDGGIRSRWTGPGTRVCRNRTESCYRAPSMTSVTLEVAEDRGRLFLEESAGGSPEGAGDRGVFRIEPCPSPVCPCRRITFVEAVGDGAEGDSAARRFVLDPFMRCAAEVDAGDDALAREVAAAMSVESWEALARLFLGVKARAIEAIDCERERASFRFEEIERDAVLVPYRETIPFDHEIRVRDGARELLVDEQDRVRSGCDCAEAIIVVLEVERGEARRGEKASKEVAALAIDHDTGHWHDAETGGPLNGEARELSRRLREQHPDLLATLGRRHAVLRRLYRSAAAAAGYPIGVGSAASTARTRVGRNDPCPCGSGRKYKKCCLTSGG